MPEMTDRDGDRITVTPSRSDTAGVWLKTSTPWGVELTPHLVKELKELLESQLERSIPKAVPGDIWESRESPGRQVEVLGVTREGVMIKTIADSHAVVARLEAGEKAARSGIGQIRHIGWKNWAPMGSKRGYFRIKEGEE